MACKKIKEMTKEELAEYRHNAYLKRRNKDKAYSKQYYKEHKEAVLANARKRYRKKCGL